MREAVARARQRVGARAAVHVFNIEELVGLRQRDADQGRSQVEGDADAAGPRFIGDRIVQRIAAVETIVAETADQRVAARAAQQRVGAGAAAKTVVAAEAGEHTRHRTERGERVRSRAASKILDIDSKIRIGCARHNRQRAGGLENRRNADILRVIGHEIIAAGAAVDAVIASAAEDGVVALATQQRVISVTAENAVVAGIAENQIGRAVTGQRIGAGAGDDIFNIDELQPAAVEQGHRQVAAIAVQNHGHRI